jgi:chitinase
LISSATFHLFLNLKDFPRHKNELNHVSPIYPRLDESIIEQRFNIDFTVNYWLYKGLPREKLVLGIGLYGKKYQLVSPSMNKLGSIADSWNSTNIPNELSYAETCNLVENSRWILENNSEQMISYIYNKTEWISYEDITSVKLKANYLVDNKLAGVAIWVSYNLL